MFHSNDDPMSPEFTMINFRELELPNVTVPNGIASLSSLISNPWQAPVTVNNVCERPAHSKITCGIKNQIHSKDLITILQRKKISSKFSPLGFL